MMFPDARIHLHVTLDLDALGKVGINRRAPKNSPWLIGKRALAPPTHSNGGKFERPKTVECRRRTNYHQSLQP